MVRGYRKGFILKEKKKIKKRKENEIKPFLLLSDSYQLQNIPEFSSVGTGQVLLGQSGIPQRSLANNAFTRRRMFKFFFLFFFSLVEKELDYPMSYR